jgi:Family of unknown function (DUF6207)
MKQITDAHVAAPGLVVVDIAAADDETAFVFQEALAAQWATARTQGVIFLATGPLRRGAASESSRLGVKPLALDAGTLPESGG